MIAECPLREVSYRCILLKSRLALRLNPMPPTPLLSLNYSVPSLLTTIFQFSIISKHNEKSLVTQSLGPGTVHITPVLGSRLLPHRTSPPRHDKQAQIPDKSNSSHGTVDGKVATCLEPWRDTKVDGKREGITDDDTGRDHLTRELRIAGDGVVECTGNGEG